MKFWFCALGAYVAAVLVYAVASDLLGVDQVARLRRLRFAWDICAGFALFVAYVALLWLVFG